ncbi:hypothetical protein ACB098_11G077300 [Castanea mollissima]|uniref:Mesoderm development candidate 2 n=1 Tax=Castanea mollissima TaxID=60419 RepID=A0A8J4QPK7_9ROSI|nr:hypothetical protein CMV_023697 [Castanea mollissima]
MAKYIIAIPLLLILPLLLSQNLKPVRHAEAAGPGKRRVQVTNDLDDIVDNEEDEAWKEWGKKSTSSGDESDLRPSDLWKMSDAEIQAEMMNPHYGSSIGLVKLRFRSPPTEDMVADTAMKWTKVLKTGGIGARFMGIDLGTILFTIERGQDTTELREFLLDQPEAYEIRIGDQTFRRPGDPPFEEVIAKLQNEKNKVDNNNTNPTENGKELKEEL